MGHCVAASPWAAQNREMPSEVKIQLCGHTAVVLDGRRIEDELPGRQGRVLFTFLAVNRLRASSRGELVEALWPHQLPARSDGALSALLSKLRRALGPDLVEGRSELRLVLPAGTVVDLETAGEAIHRAESAIRRGAWAAAWGPARVALHTANRGFLPGVDAPWADDVRRHLADMRLRAHECVARSGLGLGGAELDSALRSGRSLVELAPLRESGYRLLMQALEAEGNTAEALAVYDGPRTLLREELGTAPGQPTQELYKTLLG